jgi:hypothetical protein
LRRRAPFEERLAAAKSVKVQTTVLGIKLDSPLAMAHTKLDSLGDPTKPPIEAKEEAGNDEEEYKVAWDVVRPGWPLIRVIARGANRKAASTTLFIVNRARHTAEARTLGARLGFTLGKEPARNCSVTEILMHGVSISLGLR